jgi:hypothetical protein
MALYSNMATSTKVVLGAIAVFVVGMLGFVAFTYWDANVNYAAAKGQVTSVVDNCTLERRRSKGRRQEVGPMACDEAQLKQSQGYSRYSLKRHRHVGYAYTSPVNGQRYGGTISATPSDYPDVRVGAEIDILAHESDPEKSRRPI